MAGKTFSHTPDEARSVGLVKACVPQKIYSVPEKISYKPLIMLMFGSFPFGVLSPVRKYAICVSIIGPLTLIGTTLLCQGGIQSVDLTVPIVAL